MLTMPYRPRKALGYAILLWVIGFSWGTAVYMVPAMWSIPSVPYISKLPAVSAALIILCPIVIFLFSKTYLKATNRKSREGLNFGVTILFVNVVLDLLVYVIMFESFDYFAYASIWIAYALFLLVPWLVGRRLERKIHDEER